MARAMWTRCVPGVVAVSVLVSIVIRQRRSASKHVGA